MTIDRLERLTDLVLVLLDTPRLLTLDEICVRVPGYPENPPARRQAFERDKRLLRDDGIEITTGFLDGTDRFGYRIDPDAWYLQDLEFTDEEQAAVRIAVAAVRLGNRAASDGLAKLGMVGVDGVSPLIDLEVPPVLTVLFDAVSRRARVEFGYRDTPRSVAPGRLVFRQGRWYLIGHDIDRDAVRTFRIDRFDDVPVVGTADSGVLPPDFDPADAVPAEPWNAASGTDGVGDDDVVVIKVDAVEESAVLAEVGGDAVVERCDDGSVLVRLGMTSRDAMRSWVLCRLTHLEVVSPTEFRDHVVSWLMAISESEPVADAEIDAVAEAEADSRSDTESLRAPPSHSGEGVKAPVPSGSQERAEVISTSGAARLRRLLAMIGWLAQVGEASIEEIAERFRMTHEDVIAELELAACCGLPPHSPDMLLEIEVSEDSVRAFLPKELGRPRHLSAAEGFAVAASMRSLLAVPGSDPHGALAEALGKVESALGSHVDVRVEAPPLLPHVLRALDAGDLVEIEYHSASKDVTTRRIVDPVSVISLEGRWYLDAFCFSSDDRRRFRVDRIRSLVPGAKQGPGGPLSLSDPLVESDRDRDRDRESESGRAGRVTHAFTPDPDAEMIRIILGPEAKWVENAIPTESVTRLGENTMVTLFVGGMAWLERLLLQAGAEARVLDPPNYRDVARHAALRVLAGYQNVNEIT